MQVDPIKPTLKSPETKYLKLNCDEPLSSFGFNFNLRRYIEESAGGDACRDAVMDAHDTCSAGAYTRPLFSST